MYNCLTRPASCVIDVAKICIIVLMNLGGNTDVFEILVERMHRGIERSHVKRKWQTLFRSQIQNLEILDTHTHTHTHTSVNNAVLVFCEMVFEKIQILQLTHMDWFENILNYLFWYPKQ